MSTSHHIIGYTRATYLTRVADEYNNAFNEDGRKSTSAQSMLREHLNVTGSLHKIDIARFENAVDFLLSLALLVNPAFELPIFARPFPASHRSLTKQEGQARSKRHRKSIYKSLTKEAATLVSSVRRRLYKTTAGWHPRLGKVASKRTAQVLGCSPQELRRHIELQFAKGMGWHNRTEWHVDHIVPLASAQSEDELFALMHFTNLRPIWGVDNLKKSAKKLFLI
jgi:hypothetical protein